MKKFLIKFALYWIDWLFWSRRSIITLTLFERLIPKKSYAIISNLTWLTKKTSNLICFKQNHNLLHFDSQILCKRKNEHLIKIYQASFCHRLWFWIENYFNNAGKGSTQKFLYPCFNQFHFPFSHVSVGPWKTSPWFLYKI